MKFIPALSAILITASTWAADTVAWPERIVRGVNTNFQVGEEDISHYARGWNGYAARFLVNDITDAKPPYAVREEEKAKIFRSLDLSLKYNLLTIFSPDASFDVNDEFFGNDKWRNAFKAFWREVAVRYKDQGPIVYDLVNEPWGDEARRRWTSYAKELTAAIREVDGRHTIMVEPPEWGWPNGFRYLEPTGDRNTVYSFHFYGPMDFTHQRNGGHMKTTEKQWRERVYPGFLQGEKWNKERFRKEVRTAAAWRDKYGVKIWCGEFGVARWARGRWIGCATGSTYWRRRGSAGPTTSTVAGSRWIWKSTHGADSVLRGETDFVVLFKKYFKRTD